MKTYENSGHEKVVSKLKFSNNANLKSPLTTKNMKDT